MSIVAHGYNASIVPSDCQSSNNCNPSELPLRPDLAGSLTACRAMLLRTRILRWIRPPSCEICAQEDAGAQKDERNRALRLACQRFGAPPKSAAGRDAGKGSEVVHLKSTQGPGTPLPALQITLRRTTTSVYLSSMSHSMWREPQVLRSVPFSDHGTAIDHVLCRARPRASKRQMPVEQS